jgi:CheY-like chemotaxis protein
MDDLLDQNTFLVLEDDADDALLIRRAFTNAACRVFVCRNTSEARAYLVGAGMYADRDRFPFPQIFVTDLRLGDESGVQFLRWLRGKEELKALPVVVLSGLASAEDIRAAKALGVQQILEKPADESRLQTILLNLASQLCSSAEHRGEAARESVGMLSTS